MKALPTKAAGLFQAPLSQMARLAKALEEKKQADGAAEALTAEAVVAAEAPVEAVAEGADEASEASPASE
jgi:large subunit ribosomal protein L10